MGETAERTCETCGHNGKTTCDAGYCLRGPGMWKPSPSSQDADECIDLLRTIYTAYQDGPACYDNPDDGVYIGNAVRLSESVENKIADMLDNRRRPLPPQPEASDREIAQQYIDDLWVAFAAKYGDVYEKVFAVINKREESIRGDERRRCADRFCDSCAICDRTDKCPPR